MSCMNEIAQILHSIGVPESETQRFLELARRTEVTKGTYFIREGYATSRLGFVERGLFRSLYLAEDGEEYTFAFSAENDFIYECNAMRSSDIAQYSVQAIESSQIVEVNYEVWVEPFKDSVWWNKILLDLTELELSLKRRREVELLNLDARARYAHFLEQHADIGHRIKQRMVATYLGVTPVTLSRIRKDMSTVVHS